MSAPTSRMCRWCGQAYTLGRRREFLPYCGFGCYWFDHADDARQLHDERLAQTIELWLTGGNGLLHLTGARVYEPVAPLD